MSPPTRVDVRGDTEEGGVKVPAAWPSYEPLVVDAALRLITMAERLGEPLVRTTEASFPLFDGRPTMAVITGWRLWLARSRTPFVDPYDLVVWLSGLRSAWEPLVANPSWPPPPPTTVLADEASMVVWMVRALHEALFRLLGEPDTADEWLALGLRLAEVVAFQMQSKMVRLGAGLATPVEKPEPISARAAPAPATWATLGTAPLPSPLASTRYVPTDEERRVCVEWVAGWGDASTHTPVGRPEPLAHWYASAFSMAGRRGGYYVMHMAGQDTNYKITKLASVALDVLGAAQFLVWEDTGVTHYFQSSPPTF